MVVSLAVRAEGVHKSAFGRDYVPLAVVPSGWCCVVFAYLCGDVGDSGVEVWHVELLFGGAECCRCVFFVVVGEEADTDDLVGKRPCGC